MEKSQPLYAVPKMKAFMHIVQIVEVLQNLKKKEEKDFKEEKYGIL